MQTTLCKDSIDILVEHADKHLLNKNFLLSYINLSVAIEHSNNSPKLPDLHIKRGLVARMQGGIESEFYLRAESDFQKSSELAITDSQMAESLLGLADLQRVFYHNTELANWLIHDAIPYSENDPVLKAKAYDQIGLIHHVKKEYEEALDNYNIAINSLPDVQNAKAKDRKAQIHLHLASTYISMNNLNEAIKANSVAINLFEELKDKHGQKTTYQNQAKILLLSKDYNQAIDMYELALDKMGDTTRGKPGIHIGITKCYLEQNNHDKALKHIKSFIHYAKQPEVSSHDLRTWQETINDVYSKIQNDKRYQQILPEMERYQQSL